jgi:hypothetical protein
MSHDETKLTFEDLVARRVGFDALIALRDAGRVAEDELQKYCSLQDEFTARIFAGSKARGAPETAKVREVFTEADLATFWNGALERARAGAVLQ